MKKGQERTQTLSQTSRAGACIVAANKPHILIGMMGGKGKTLLPRWKNLLFVPIGL